ncbi:MAG: acyltransferase [Caulobacteraceae bacterium]
MSKRPPIYGLDIIRCLAAFLVLYFHIGYISWLEPTDVLRKHMAGPPLVPPGWQLGSVGWIGVEIFFVVSGVVIAYSMEGISAGGFVRRRALRLVPALLICTSLAAVIALFFFQTPFREVALLWWRTNLFVPAAPWLIGQFWTLPIEVVFYGLVWLLICFRQQARIEALAWVLAVLSLSYWVTTSLFGVHDPHGRTSQLLLLQQGCYFALGVLLSQIDRKGISASRLALGVVCLLSAPFEIRSTVIYFQAAATAPELLPAGPNVVGTLMVFVVFVGAIACSLAFKETIAARVGRLAEPIRQAGLLSYPLYLIHMHAGGVALILAWNSGAPIPLAIFTASAVAIAVSLSVSMVAEPWLRKRISQALDRAASRWARAQ